MTVTERPDTTACIATIRRTRPVWFILVIALLLGAAPALLASDPIQYGYRDFAYPGGTGGNSEPTGEKPESKLWWNDGSWWGSMWSTEGDAYHIYRLDTATQTWIDTETPLDSRSDSRADALWDGQHLYVASHIFAQNAGAPSNDPDQRGMLFRYSYSSGSYTLDSGFPVEVTGGESETLVVEKDSSGQLWVTYVEDQKVMVNHSLNGDDRQWGTPYMLPVDQANVSSDDVSSIITYNQHVGVMWSNQNSPRDMYFAVHPVGAGDDVWTQVRAYGASGDDHISLKSLEADSEGNVYAVIKTSDNDALIMLLVCERNVNRCRTQSDWTSYFIYDDAHRPTRPILLIDTSNRQLYVFTRNIDENNDQGIYYKTSSLDSISFPSGIGTPFIKSLTETGINDPTSTKQNLTSTTGLVVLASDGDYYFHNYLPLSGMPQHTLTVNVDPRGSGNVTLDPPGGVYNDGQTVSLTATAEPGWTFDGWSGDLSGASSEETLLMDGNKTVTATFAEEPPPPPPPEYSLTVNVNPAGSGSVSLDPPGGTYEEGTDVELTATAASGWQFDGWSGALTGTTNPATVTMDGDKTVTATFTEIPPPPPPEYTLTVNVDPAGAGSVWLDPPGGTYEEGTQVELTATAASGWQFDGWSGALTGTTNPATVTMDGDKTVTATFVEEPPPPPPPPPPEYTLTVNVDPAGSGSVSLDPPGGTYEEGTQVELTATAASGWQFDGWSGALTGSTNPATVTMDGDKTVTAVFSRVQFTLAVSHAGAGEVLLDPPGGLYDAGTTVTLTANPDAGWRFASWSGALTGSHNPATVVMDAAKTVSATFVQNQPGIQINIGASTMTATVGQVLTYTYSVANIGEATLNDVTVSDDRFGAVSLDRTTLAAGETAVGYGFYTVRGGDLPGPLINNASATGLTLGGQEVSHSAGILVNLRPLPFVYHLPISVVTLEAEGGGRAAIFHDRVAPRAVVPAMDVVFHGNGAWAVLGLALWPGAP